MGSDIRDTVRIYEINGFKYTGEKKIDIKSHPRFVSFVTLCIDNQEYSVGADDLMRAVDHIMGQLQIRQDDALVGGRSA